MLKKKEEFKNGLKEHQSLIARELIVFILWAFLHVNRKILYGPDGIVIGLYYGSLVVFYYLLFLMAFFFI